MNKVQGVDAPGPKEDITMKFVSAIYNDNSAVSESIIELMKRGLESKNA